MLQCGSLYWASLPGDKRRPVLVISPQARNAHAGDVLVVPCSTVLREGPWHVRLAKGEGGVRQASVLKCEQVTTLPVHYLDPQPLGPSLAPRQLARVERAIMRAIGIPVPL